MTVLLLLNERRAGDLDGDELFRGLLSQTLDNGVCRTDRIPSLERIRFGRGVTSTSSPVVRLSEPGSSGIVFTTDPLRCPPPSFPESSASASRSSPTTDQSSSESTPCGRTRVRDGVSGTDGRPGGGASEPMELASSRSDSVTSESCPRSP